VLLLFTVENNYVNEQMTSHSCCYVGQFFWFCATSRSRWRDDEWANE